MNLENLLYMPLPFYLFLLVCFVIFFISVYKIHQWYRRQGVGEAVSKLRQQQKANTFYPIYSKVSRLRAIWFVGMLAAILVAMTIIPDAWPVAIKALVIPSGFIILYVINNILVNSVWRCPICGGQLPRKVGRSSQRPVWVEFCSHCGYGKSAQQSSYEDPPCE